MDMLCSEPDTNQKEEKNDLSDDKNEKKKEFL